MIDLTFLSPYLTAYLTGMATLGACCALGWAAFTDMTDARIDNRANVLLLCAGVVATYFAQDPTWHIAAAAVTFASTFFLWQTDNLGGGDVKMLTLVALCLGAVFPWFLVAFGFAAAVIGVTRTVILPRIWQRRDKQGLVPMGAAAFPAFAFVVMGGLG